jgi:hypothetical protein
MVGNASGCVVGARKRVRLIYIIPVYSVKGVNGRWSKTTWEVEIGDGRSKMGIINERWTRRGFETRWSKTTGEG